MSMTADIHFKQGTPVEVGPLYDSGTKTWTATFRLGGGSYAHVYFDSAQHVADVANDLLDAVRVYSEPPSDEGSDVGTIAGWDVT